MFTLEPGYYHESNEQNQRAFDEHIKAALKALGPKLGDTDTTSYFGLNIPETPNYFGLRADKLTPVDTLSTVPADPVGVGLSNMSEQISVDIDAMSLDEVSYTYDQMAPETLGVVSGVGSAALLRYGYMVEGIPAIAAELTEGYGGEPGTSVEAGGSASDGSTAGGDGGGDGASGGSEE